MAVLVFQRGDELYADYVLGASSVATTKVPPATWYVALATRLVSNYSKTASVWSATDTGTNVAEIGSSTAANYARQAINHDQSGAGWAQSTSDSTGANTNGVQVVFPTFSGAPNPNGADSWHVTDGTTLNAGNLYFGGDTSAERNYGAGDVEKVTPSLKAN